MRYRIKMMSKDEIFITEEEYQKILKSKTDGLIFIESIRGMINMRSVETILPENIAPKKEQTSGVLHDGTKVVKDFGVWRDANNYNVRLDPTYYPEISNDTVMTYEEYKKAIATK